MKVLEIDYDYYYYPNDISCLDEFVSYANENYNSFIKMKKFDTNNCVFPYFISEETKDIYLNIAKIETIGEVDVTILCKLDYDARLEQVVTKKCLDCIHYEDDMEGDNLKGHRDKLSLDGECWGYERITE